MWRLLVIPYGRQAISDDDILSVQDVLRSDWLTQGPTVELFEKSVAHYCGAQHSVAICNATSALHLACLALGLAPNDTVWTSPNTFVASANCALYCGANIDFVDIDPRTYNICPKALARKLEQAELAGKLPKIVIPVHFAGQPCDMQAIHVLAKKYNFFIIEDASHAIGATYLTTKIGDCSYSDITIFSFHPVKLITTGEGGMALTNNPDLHHKLILLRSHGITRDQDHMTKQSEGDWYYQQIALGYNYRMTDIQAALGRSQLQQLDKFIERRRHLVERYDAEFSQLPILLPWQHTDGKSAWHLYVIQLHNADKRQAVFNALIKAGIHVNVHYIPIHTQPFYQRLGFNIGDYPEAEMYYQRAITLPLYYKLRDEEQSYIIEKLRNALQ
jgi:UDP-4-amino-4,6-dideoxy-N-acetyl-beta-L-altrosamine transaminase